MRPALAVTSVSILLLLGLARPAWSQAPLVEPDSCVYLVGAPAGAIAAGSESTGAASRIGVPCTMTANATTGADGPNSAQILIQQLNPIFDSCAATSATWHEFQVAGGPSPVTGRVDLAGRIHGAYRRATDYVSPLVLIEATLEELDPLRGALELLGRTEIVRWEGASREEELDRDFGVTLTGVFHPGRTYRVSLRLSAEAGQRSDFIDFGPPGTGRGARYDSIEVCLDAPVGGTDDEAALRDLEEKLYLKQCMPTVWLPASQGGRLEEARDLLADLLARATASGDPGVNARVAGMRLASADADILEGSYQRACRNISDGVRALTTP